MCSGCGKKQTKYAIKPLPLGRVEHEQKMCEKCFKKIEKRRKSINHRKG